MLSRKSLEVDKEGGSVLSDLGDKGQKLGESNLSGVPFQLPLTKRKKRVSRF